MGFRHDRLAWMLVVVAIAGCQAPEARSEASGEDRSGLSSRPPSNSAGPANAPSVPPSDAPAGGAGPAPEDREAIERACGVHKVKRHINAKLTESVKAEIAQAVGQNRVRYIRPGDAVTMDFSPTRLNVHLGSDERIVSFRCG